MSRKVTDYEIGSRDDGRTATLAGTSLIYGVFSGIFNIIFLTILIRVFMM